MVRMVFTANAGVLLQAGGSRFLIDALHDGRDYPFSPVPEALLRRMRHGDPDLGDVEYLIYTHSHSDHYSPALTLEYLRANRVRRVLLPEPPDDPALEEDLLAYMRSMAIPWWRLGLSCGQSRIFRLSPSVYLAARGMRHTGERFSDRVCACLLVSAGGRRILFAGDCACDSAGDYGFLRDAGIDAACVNPLFFHSQPGRDALRALRCAHVVIYHIPFEQDDRLSLRALARQSIAKYGSEFSSVTALWTPGQEIRWQ